MFRKALVQSVLIVISCTSFAHAESSNTDQSSPAKDFYWKGVLIIGRTFSGKTSYTVNDPNGNPVGASSDKAKSDTIVGGEWTYQSTSVFGMSALAQSNRYTYKDEPSVYDKQIGLYLMPRLAQTFGDVEIWGGVGLGLMITKIGGATSLTSNGILLTLVNTTIPSFAWTPRVGVDINVGEVLVVGGQLEYVQTTATANFTAISGTSAVSFTEDFTRNWFGASVRVGAKF